MNPGPSLRRDRRHPTWSHFRFSRALALVVFASMAFVTSVARSAAPGDEAAPEAGAPEVTATEELALDQEQIGSKFRRFEEVLLRMAELSATSDPGRAALLRKTVAMSKDRLIGLQIEELSELLRTDRLATATNSQSDLEQDLRQLLELMLSEERDDRVRQEMDDVREQIKQLNAIIAKEKEIQTQTATGGELPQLAQQQGKLAGEAGDLAQQMQAQAGEAGEGQGEPGEGGMGESGEGQGEGQGQGQGQKGEKGEPGGEGEAKPGKSPTEPGEGAKGEGGEKSPSAEPGEGQGEGQGQGKGQGQGQGQGEGQEGEQSPGDQSPPSEGGNSAQSRVQTAQKHMDDARQKLEQARREGAVEDEQKALDALAQAKADLEEILRQLREEELERMLAMLEARFAKMKEMQLEVYEGTLRLDLVPEDQRDRNDEIESGRLSRKESMIVIEADKALQVLREEGSAAAFPEAVEQMREDMENVVLRLAQAKVDEITQAVEEDIIAALEEMIEALQKAQQELEEQKEKNEPPPPGEAQEPPLIDMLAELKMIRSLQERVNARTNKYASLVADDEVGQADKPELVDALHQLSDREQRIHEVTRDIVVGKTQ